MIFHEYFLKSSVGDTKWKTARLEADDKSLSDPLISVQGEAFAMIILKNNYFAWLWEAKLKYEDFLCTDYDTDSELENKVPLGVALLKMAELNLAQDAQEEENDEDDAEASSLSARPVAGISNLSYENLLVPESTSTLYCDLRKKNEAVLKKTRRAARKNAKYKELKKLLEEGEVTSARTGVVPPAAGNNGAPRDEEEERVKQEKRSKKRKILKSFRDFTNPREDEGRFKGWSKRASDEMEVLQLALNQERNTTKARLFRAAYRLSFKAKNLKGKKKRAAEDEELPVDYESNLWGLGHIAEIEEI
jgi:hypothetical protein